MFFIIIILFFKIKIFILLLYDDGKEFLVCFKLMQGGNPSFLKLLEGETFIFSFLKPFLKERERERGKLFDGSFYEKEICSLKTGNPKSFIFCLRPF